MKIIEVKEYESINVALNELTLDGRLFIDPRVAGRGYLEVCIKGPNLEFRAGRFVGLIPLNREIAIRVLPKLPIGNLTQMLVESGELASVLNNFEGGYLPTLVYSPKAIEHYHQQLLDELTLIMSRGLKRNYTVDPSPPQWRGRLLPTETVTRFASHGVKYRAAFEFKTLSSANVENFALNEALKIVKTWMRKQQATISDIRKVSQLEKAFLAVPPWKFGTLSLARKAVQSAMRLPPSQEHYRRGLWAAIAILQSAIPEIESTGQTGLDSMILDMSTVYESYLRSALEAAATDCHWKVKNGNINRLSFFSDNRGFDLKPDFIITDDSGRSAVFDAKYKARPEEKDRYSLLAFMDGAKVSDGALILPKGQGGDHSHSHFLGTTHSKRSISIIRVDLKAADMRAEKEKLIKNVGYVLEGTPGRLKMLS